jgi:hypothetical protein
MKKKICLYIDLLINMHLSTSSMDSCPQTPPSLKPLRWTKEEVAEGYFGLKKRKLMSTPSPQPLADDELENFSLDKTTSSPPPSKKNKKG